MSLHALVHCMMAPTPDRRFISLVLKNLAAHRPRNQKTAVMFTIAITFVVFVGSIFFLQGASLVSNVRVAFGAVIVVCVTRPCCLPPGITLTMPQVRALAEQRREPAEPLRLAQRD